MNENQNNHGAPSSDNTSALFVSARKKQLAEQEEQRVAAEKEAARQAAEEEVRRLEAEVAERKKKAEQDAVMIQQEEQERRRNADLEKARIEQELKAAASGQPVRSTPPPPYGQVATGSTVAAKNSKSIGAVLAENKMLVIIGAAAVAFVLVVIIILAVVFGGSAPRFTYTLNNESYLQLNEDGTTRGVSPDLMEFSGTWYVDSNQVYITSDTYNTVLGVINQDTIYDYNFDGEFVFGT